jgi:beta-lactamase class A
MSFLMPFSALAAVSHSQTRSSSLDSPLEAEIDQYIKQLRQSKQLAHTDRTSFVVYDIDNKKKIVSINEDQPRIAASLIKVFVMLAYFHQVEQKLVNHTEQNRIHLARMIQVSSNPSTNYFIKLLGGPRNVNRILHANYPEFKQTRIVEYIPRGGRTYRNTTSAKDLTTFYTKLWTDRLPYASKMKHYLGLPNRDRMVTNTSIPAIEVYNKTGTVYSMVGDSGVLLSQIAGGRQRAYVFTGLIEDRSKINVRKRYAPFASWVRNRANILRRVSEKVYQYMYVRGLS